jgi:hypothetical protein
MHVPATLLVDNGLLLFDIGCIIACGVRVEGYGTWFLAIRRLDWIVFARGLIGYVNDDMRV